MNPLEWEAIQRLQRNLDPNHQNNNMENTSGTPNDWDPYCQYSRYTVDEPQGSTGVDLGSEARSPPSHEFYTKGTEDEDPDGEPMADEDPELTRKRKELKAIEEQILRKKVAIALKKVEPFVKGTPPQGFSSSEESATFKSASLQDRVNVILQQRHPVSSLSKVQSREDGINSSSLNKDLLLQTDHPLKLRVKAIMKQRYSEPGIMPTNKEAPHVSPPPLSQSVTSPAKEENGVNQGFQRFLSVLNKGVDMDLLSRIVNDDSADLPLGEELLNIQPPALENKSDLPFRSESQRSNSGASHPGHSRTNSREKKSQEKSLYRPSLPGDDKKKSDRGDLCFGSSSRSKSPPAVKKTKKKEEKPKVDEQCAQLQNVLKSLGLSLEIEEMSRLSDRTQERLYGKKNDSIRFDSRGEQESREKGPHRQNRISSSSSSSSPSSSRSTSRSCSSSPSRPQRSRSRDLKQKQRSKHSRSRSRSRDRAQAHRDRDKKDSKETLTYECPYPPNQTYPHPHPSDSSKFPDSLSLSQYTEYHAYNSGAAYSAATTSYWTYTQGAIPPSTYPSVHPYPQDTYSHFPDAVAAPSTVYPHHHPLEDMNLFVNPDLSKSEGQTGFTSGPRCLQVISTKQPTQSFVVKQVTKAYRMRKKRFWRKKKHSKKNKKKQIKALQRAQVAPQRNEDNSKAKESEQKKRPRTDEEIKANLRKTLEAFNQKVKKKLTQTLTETLAHSEWLKSMEHHEHLQIEPALNPDRPYGPHF
ncbi:hypothetical protein D9C73_003364 [Collichthys lucidus]|uniref:Zinc finger protein 318 n=1 Tax=Collichthys lucidus TaxID=240159 RepID=A0A4U5U633_COLLU|nr:hypothetical protein D9C73_003364 [Collichthys lucidus]